MEEEYGAPYVMERNSEEEMEEVGWFHAKFKSNPAVKWANNYKLQLAMGSLYAGLLLCTVVYSDVEVVSIGLVSGGFLSILSCCAVIFTYSQRRSWRKHPNPFLFYRSVCDLMLVVLLLLSHGVTCYVGDCQDALDGSACTLASGGTQFFLLASESWFFVMAIDMYKSLKSPFTDYKHNVRLYHMFVWGVAGFTGFLLMVIPNAAGYSEFGYCWTKRIVDESIVDRSVVFDLNTRTWFFFYIWMIGYFAYAISIIVLAWKRLNAGLNETLRMRLRVLHSVTLYVLVISIYWAITFGVYVPYLVLQVPECESECSTKIETLKQLLLFMISSKGYFDFLVWFQINELTYNDGIFKFSSAEEKMKGDVDVDLNPQVNLALRCEVLYYTTTGIIQAVNDTQHLPPGATQQALYLQPQGIQSDRATPRESMHPIYSSKKRGRLFIDYCPHTFRAIREHFGYDASNYSESLKKTTKERLSEGASGAFMFFSHDQRLIVKSMSQDEADFLRSIAKDYASYLFTHPDSLLTRFYGCHSIKLYGSTFSFVVMENLFSTSTVIHRRYDIKGSWVNRSAKHPSKGKRVTCRHCNGVFVYGAIDANTMCPMRLGKHEPNTVLKDNDLTSKVRLDENTAQELYQQVVMDASFLSRLGIMDYSLLLGVHNVEYMVEDIPALNSNKKAKDLNAKFVIPSGKAKKRSYSVQAKSDQGSNATNSAAGDARSISEATENIEQYSGTRKAKFIVGPQRYYFGLIDILQTWSFSKRMERLTKVHLLRQDQDGISAVSPSIYRDRFALKMADILGITLNTEAEYFANASKQRPVLGRNESYEISNDYNAV